jgi:hypothetical protein
LKQNVLEFIFIGVNKTCRFKCGSDHIDENPDTGPGTPGEDISEIL